MPKQPLSVETKMRYQRRDLKLLRAHIASMQRLADANANDGAARPADHRVAWAEVAHEAKRILAATAVH
jgi:hypothetical protein